MQQTACEDDEYCYGQKCLECSSPTPVNSDGYVGIDNNPKAGDEWKFRSRDCNEDVSTQDQTIDIYGIKKEDGTRVFLTSVDNSADLDSFGRTAWTNESNEYRSLVARKQVGSPDNAVFVSPENTETYCVFVQGRWQGRVQDI